MTRQERLEQWNKIVFTNDSDFAKARFLFYAFLLALVAILGCLQILWMNHRSDHSSPSLPEPVAALSLDSYIPKGFSLVPIEIANASQVDALVESTATVDLFVGNPEKSLKTTKIASQVRLLRAPKNPLVFAILVPRGEVERILRQPALFWVTVLNPDQEGSHIAKPRKRMQIIADE